MYHQVMAYDHFIAYNLLTFVIIEMEGMINDFAARKLRHAKRYFNIMSPTVHTSGCNKIYFIIPHIAFIILRMSPLYHAVG